MLARKVVVLLLLLVMAGNVIGIVVAGSEKSQNVNGQLSANDIFNVSKIKERSEKYSKEEIQKMYNVVTKRAKEQYSQALQKIESRKIWYQNTNDVETNSVTINSYYHADYTADGGESAHGGSGVGNSDAWIDGNEIHVWSRAEGPYGEYWAHGRVWDRFTYTADDHWVKVKVYYYLRGRLLALGGDNDISIYLRVYDVTAGTEVDKKLIFNNEGNAYYDNVLKSGQTYVYLKNGHTYDIELIAETGASAFYVSGALSDFGYWEFDGDWRWVKWYYDEVTWV